MYIAHTYVHIMCKRWEVCLYVYVMHRLPAVITSMYITKVVSLLTVAAWYVYVCICVAGTDK